MSPSSTRDATAKASAAPLTRIAVYRTTDALTAYQVSVAKDRVVLRGRPVEVLRGDWVVCAGTDAIEVFPDGEFQRTYTPITPAGLTLTPEDHTAIEQIFGFGSTRDSASLRKSIERMVKLSIGDIAVNFTVPQWEELARRADRRGVKIGAYMQQVVDRLTQDLWTAI